LDIPTESVSNRLTLMTAQFEPPKDFKNKLVVALPTPSTGIARGFYVHPIEGNTWLLNILTYGNDTPPTEKDKLEFLSKVRYDRELLATVLSWKQVTEWNVYHEPPNKFKHYEQVSNFPENFVVLGDAVASFNPSFAQGMTNATLHADALDRVLRNHIMKYPVHDFKGVSKKIQQECYKVSFEFWDMVEGEDLGFPTTIGNRTKLKEFKSLLLQNIIHTCLKTPELTLLLFKVVNVVNGRELLFHPKIIFPALLAMIKHIITNKSLKQPIFQE